MINFATLFSKKTIIQIIIFVLLIGILAKLNGYPHVNNVWSLTELADHISEHEITTIILYDVGVAAVTQNDKIIFVFILARDIDGFLNQLIKAGANVEAIQLLEIQHLKGPRLQFDGRIILPIVAYLLITTYQKHKTYSVYSEDHYKKIS